MASFNASQVTKYDKVEFPNEYFRDLAEFINVARKRGGSTKELIKYTDDDLPVVKWCNNEVYDCIKNYIHKFIHENYPTYLNSDTYEEMVVECTQRVFETFPKYNGESKLTTFFKPEFHSACNNVISNGRTRYYNEQGNKINKIKQSLISKGLKESDITIADIQKEFTEQGIEMTEKRIESALRQNSVRHEEYTQEKVDNYKNFKSPEDTLLEKEKLKEAFDILNTLYDYEKIAFCFYIGYFDQSIGFYSESGKRLNYSEIAKNPVFVKAYVEYFGENDLVVEDGKKVVKLDTVKSIISKTKKKISNHPERMKKIDRKRSEYGATSSLLNGIDEANKNIEILTDN